MNFSDLLKILKSDHFILLWGVTKHRREAAGRKSQSFWNWLKMLLVLNWRLFVINALTRRQFSCFRISPRQGFPLDFQNTSGLCRAQCSVVAQNCQPIRSRHLSSRPIRIGHQQLGSACCMAWVSDETKHGFGWNILLSDLMIYNVKYWWLRHCHCI